MNPRIPFTELCRLLSDYHLATRRTVLRAIARQAIPAPTKASPKKQFYTPDQAALVVTYFHGRRPNPPAEADITALVAWYRRDGGTAE